MQSANSILRFKDSKFAKVFKKFFLRQFKTKFVHLADKGFVVFFTPLRVWQPGND